MKIHEVIRNKRKEKRKTQEELARYLGVSAPAVNKWEKGISFPDISLLPVLAAYFDITVDDLLGYEPQMEKEAIRKLYHHMAERFAKEPFEAVKADCEEYTKKYASCFPLLLQMAVLYLNHGQLAKNPQVILDEIIEMLDCIIEQCGNLRLVKEAEQLKAGCYLMMNRPEEVLDMFGEDILFITQEPEMQAQAYMQKGDEKRAFQTLQISMYQHLLALLEDGSSSISWQKTKSERTEQEIKRILVMEELFHLNKLHFNVMAKFYLSCAQYYCIIEEKELAVQMIERYVNCVFVQEMPLKLHGDEFFDQIDEWLSMLALGKEAPRDDATVRQSIYDAIALNPTFTCLKEIAHFEHLLKRLEEYAQKDNA